jgi:hypothetical protein
LRIFSREATAARSPWRQPGVNESSHSVSREAATATRSTCLLSSLRDWKRATSKNQAEACNAFGESPMSGFRWGS